MISCSDNQDTQRLVIMQVFESQAANQPAIIHVTVVGTIYLLLGYIVAMDTAYRSIHTDSKRLYMYVYTNVLH